MYSSNSWQSTCWDGREGKDFCHCHLEPPESKYDSAASSSYVILFQQNTSLWSRFSKNNSSTMTGTETRVFSWRAATEVFKITHPVGSWVKRKKRGRKCTSLQRHDPAFLSTRNHILKCCLDCPAWRFQQKLDYYFFFKACSHSTCWRIQCTTSPL